MNTISFTSFDNFDAPKSPSPEVEKDQKPEDFSAILSNVFTALQRENSPQVNFAPRGENVVSTAQTVSETNYNFVTVKDENPVEKTYLKNQNSLPINSGVTPNITNIHVLSGNEQPLQTLTSNPQITKLNLDTAKANSADDQLNKNKLTLSEINSTLANVDKTTSVNENKQSFNTPQTKLLNETDLANNFHNILPIKNKILDSLQSASVANGDFNNLPPNQMPSISSNQPAPSGEFSKTEHLEVKESLNLLNRDKPEVKANADASDFDGRFDNFWETISKRQGISEVAVKNEVKLSKFAEQINPNLLALVALAIRKNEKQSLNMRLHPAELGTVEIKLERNSSGVLNAHFYTETEGAKQALTNSLEQLRNSLQNAGVQVGELEIINGSSSANPNQQHRENNQPQSESVESSAFNQGSDNLDESEQTSSNSPIRLLSLLA